jgi:hypothetical protein
VKVKHWGPEDSLIKGNKLGLSRVKWFSPYLEQRSEEFNPWRWLADNLGGDFLQYATA